jgi:LytS/YehU family sensor histidine kinase
MSLSRLGRYPIDYMVVTKATLAALGLLASIALRALYRGFLPEETSLRRIVLLTVSASYLLALPWTALYNAADARIAGAMLGYTLPPEGLSQYLSGSLYHAFALLAWSVFYISIKRHLALVEERERSLQAESLAHGARLQALRFQIQPHLLFNTLNAISTLVVEHRTEEASRTISRLSDYLRQTLAAPDTHEVSLKDELAFVEGYLAIEQVRFGERLAVDIDVAAETLDCPVPTFLLQPLVENAVRHAIEPAVRGGTIGISARREGSTLVLTVSDCSRDPIDAAPSRQGLGGVGLANTRARLAQLYDGRHSLDARHLPNGGFQVEMRLPFGNGIP